MHSESPVLIERPSEDAVADPTYERDDTFYWANSVRFLVDRKEFYLPKLPFVVASEYFAERHGLAKDEESVDAVRLEEVTAAQFKNFLKALFPRLKPVENAPISFTKDEWLDILALSTLWYFNDLRKLAIDTLEPQLSPIELVCLGRSAYVSQWVIEGYSRLVMKQEAITDDEALKLGDPLTVNRLWAIKHATSGVQPVRASVNTDLHTTFAEEVQVLTAEGEKRLTDSEIALARALKEANDERQRQEEERRLEEERVAGEELKQRLEADRREREELSEQLACVPPPPTEAELLRQELHARLEELKEAREDVALWKESVKEQKQCVHARKRFKEVKEERKRQKKEELERVRQAAIEAERLREEAEAARREEEARALAQMLEEERKRNEELEALRKKEEEEQMKKELEELRAWKAEHERLEQAVFEHIEAASDEEYS